jgi:hypothetical protein
MIVSTAMIGTIAGVCMLLPGEVEVSSKENAILIRPFSTIEVDQALPALEVPDIALWDVTRMAVDGRYLIGVGPSAQSPDEATFVAWDLSSQPWDAKSYPIVTQRSIPYEIAMPGLCVTEGARLSRPAWAPQMVDGQIVLHVRLRPAALEDALAENPVPGVHPIPVPVHATRLAKYQPPQENTMAGESFPLFRHVHYFWKEGVGKRPLALIPFATPIRDNESEVSSFGYEWKSVGRTVKQGRGQWMDATLSADLQTVLINISPEAFFAGYGKRTMESKVLVWNITDARVRHEYEISDGSRWPEMNVVEPIGSSPSGDRVVYRANPAPSTGVTGRPGIFIARTTEPWNAVFILTPAMVQDIAWTNDHQATLILSRNPSVAQGGDGAPSSEPGGPPWLVAVDFDKAFAPKP